MSDEKTKHTPGPWVWEPCETKEGARYQHVRAGYRGVADTYHCDSITVLGWGRFAGHVEARHGNPADARLICAAPDLLAALRELMAPESKLHLKSDVPADVLLRAHAAILKAEGES